MPSINDTESSQPRPSLPDACLKDMQGLLLRALILKSDKKARATARKALAAIIDDAPEAAYHSLLEMAMVVFFPSCDWNGKPLPKSGAKSLGCILKNASPFASMYGEHIGYALQKMLAGKGQDYDFITLHMRLVIDKFSQIPSNAIEKEIEKNKVKPFCSSLETGFLKAMLSEIGSKKHIKNKKNQSGGAAKKTEEPVEIGLSLIACFESQKIASSQGLPLLPASQASGIVVFNRADLKNIEVLRSIQIYVEKSKNGKKGSGLLLATSEDEVLAIAESSEKGDLTIYFIGHGQIHLSGMPSDRRGRTHLDSDEAAAERVSRQLSVGPFIGNIDEIIAQTIKMLAPILPKITHFKLVSCMGGVLPSHDAFLTCSGTEYHRKKIEQDSGKMGVCAILKSEDVDPPFHPKSLAAGIWIGLIEKGELSQKNDFALSATSTMLEPDPVHPLFSASQQPLYTFSAEKVEATGNERWNSKLLEKMSPLACSLTQAKTIVVSFDESRKTGAQRGHVAGKNGDYRNEYEPIVTETKSDKKKKNTGF